MSCEECAKALEIDGAEPDCFEGECIIPPLDERGQRILKIRQRIISLQGFIDGGTVLRMYEATLEDIDLLAFVEDELKSRDNQAGQQDGQEKPG